MTVNRYYKPIEMGYFDTFVPIDFDMLYKLGSAQKAAVDEARKELNANVEKWNEFVSPLARDMEAWNEATLGNKELSGLIREASLDPQRMNDAGFRAQLNSALYNISSNPLLPKLKASAIQAQNYQTAYNKLALEGKSPAGWEPDYFNTYSTKASGVFNKAPLPYTSINDIVRDYVNDLNESFIGYEGGYNITGVSPERTVAQLDAMKSDFLSRPEVQRMVQLRTNAGMSTKDAIDSVLTEAYTSAQEQAWFKKEADPFALQFQKSNLDGSGNRPQGNTGTLTQAVESTSINFSYTQDALINEKYEQLKERIEGENKDDAALAKKEYEDYKSKLTTKKIIEELAESVTGGRTLKPEGDDSRLIFDQSQEVVRMLGSGLSADAGMIYASDIPGISADVVSTDFGKEKVINSPTTGGLLLQGTVIAGLRGVNTDSQDYVKINNALRTGSFGTVVYGGSEWVMSIPKDGYHNANYHGITIKVDAGRANELGITDQMIQNVGGTVVYTAKDQHSSSTNNRSQTKNIDVSPKGSQRTDRKSQTESESSTSQTSGDIKYYLLPVARRSSGSADGSNAEAINMAWYKRNLTPAKAGDKLSEVQQEAYQ